MTLDLPETLLQFLHMNIPTYEAADALLFFAENRDRDFSAEELVVAMRPRLISLESARKYAALFATRDLVTESNGRFRYRPASWELECRVGELSHAYNEKPVTLISAIYQVADGHINNRP